MMTKRLIWLDVLKGLGILLVIIGHSVDPYGYSAHIVFSFHMPLFFFAAGYIFKDTSFSQLIKNRARRLLLPYFFTGIIIFLYFCIILKPSQHDLNSPWTIAKIIIPQFLYGSGNVVKQLPTLGPVGPMWFLPCLFVATVFYFFLHKVMRGLNLWLQTIVVIAISCFGYILGNQISLPWSMDIAFVAQFFIFAGHILKTKPIESIPKWVIGICAIVWLIDLKYGIISMNDRKYIFFPLSMIGALAAILLMSYLCYWISKIGEVRELFVYFGTFSMIILCFHTMDNSFFQWNRYVQWVYEQSTTLFIVRIIYSVLIVEIIRRVYILRKVYT